MIRRRVIYRAPLWTVVRIIDLQRNSSSPGDDSLFEQLAADLGARGFSIQPAALPGVVSGALMHNLGTLADNDFHPAAVGRGRRSVTNPFVRRTSICWINEANRTLRPWHDWVRDLQVYLNRRLFLGLYDFESHYAVYEKGDCYGRHRDAFMGERNRLVSLVTYLNEGWQPDQGGELVLYPTGEEPIHVTPAFGTVVLFLSEEMPHEVVTTQRTRYGVAGWFRLNSSTRQQVDPPR